MLKPSSSLESGYRLELGSGLKSTGCGHPDNGGVQTTVASRQRFCSSSNRPPDRLSSRFEYPSEKEICSAKSGVPHPGQLLIISFISPAIPLARDTPCPRYPVAFRTLSFPPHLRNRPFTSALCAAGAGEVRGQRRPARSTSLIQQFLIHHRNDRSRGARERILDT